MWPLTMLSFVFWCSTDLTWKDTMEMLLFYQGLWSSKLILLLHFIILYKLILFIVCCVNMLEDWELLRLEWNTELIAGDGEGGTKDQEILCLMGADRGQFSLKWKKSWRLPLIGFITFNLMFLEMKQKNVKFVLQT